MNSFIVTLGDNGNYTSKQLLNNNMTMLLSSDKLVIFFLVVNSSSLYVMWHPKLAKSKNVPSITLSIFF